MGVERAVLQRVRAEIVDLRDTLQTARDLLVDTRLRLQQTRDTLALLVVEVSAARGPYPTVDARLTAIEQRLPAPTEPPL